MAARQPQLRHRRWSVPTLVVALGTASLLVSRSTLSLLSLIEFYQPPELDLPKAERSRLPSQTVTINRRLGISLEDVVQDLKTLTTKFYIYEDNKISLSLVLDMLRLHGEPNLSNHSSFDQVLHDVMRYRSTLLSDMWRLEGDGNISVYESWDNVLNDVRAERLTLEALEHHPLRTRDPTEAALYVVPTPISELFAYGCRWEECKLYDGAFGALKNHKLFRKTQGHNHVLISYGWYSFNKRYVGFVPALSRHYRMLENVTVASHYDSFGCKGLAESTNFSREGGFNYLFVQEMPVTKAFSIGLGLDAPFPIQPPTLEKFERSEYFVFYHSRNATADPFGYGSTRYRQKLLELNARDMTLLPRSSIGNDIGNEAWVGRIVDSKFCLVIRGDTPHSSELLHAIRAGCIPVVVSDHYQEYAGPFKSSLTMSDFCISVKENDFLKDPRTELLKLQELSYSFIKTKLRNLGIVQSIIFPDHHRSFFVEAFLTEALVANEKLMPNVLDRTLVQMKEESVVISGETLTYRYSVSFTSQNHSKIYEHVVIVGLLSSATNPDARLVVRNTWAEEYRDRILFIVSGPWKDIQEEFYEYGDILWIDMPEDYYLLTYKTQVFLHAVESHIDNYDYVLKTDDDSYIGMQELSRILNKRNPDYWGKCNWDSEFLKVNRNVSEDWYTSQALYDDKFYPPYAEGMGYVLSRSLVKCAMPKLPVIIYMPWEDVATGIIANQCDVQCNDNGYSYWRRVHPTGWMTVEHRVKRSGHMLWLHWYEMKKKKLGEWIDKPKEIMH